MTFPEELRKLRTQAYLSQAALAKIIGVDDLTVFNWEHGTHVPRAPYLLKLADYFKVEPLDLCCTVDIKATYLKNSIRLRINRMSVKQLERVLLACMDAKQDAKGDTNEHLQ